MNIMALYVYLYSTVDVCINTNYDKSRQSCVVKTFDELSKPCNIGLCTNMHKLSRLYLFVREAASITDHEFVKIVQCM